MFHTSMWVTRRNHPHPTIGYQNLRLGQAQGSLPLSCLKKDMTHFRRLPWTFGAACLVISTDGCVHGHGARTQLDFTSYSRGQETGRPRNVRLFVSLKPSRWSRTSTYSHCPPWHTGILASVGHKNARMLKNMIYIYIIYTDGIVTNT